MSLKYSIFLPTGVVGELAGFKDPIEAYEAVTRVAQTADEFGYETIWIADHVHTMPPSQAALFECWTTAAALARDTNVISFLDAPRLDTLRRFAREFIS